MFAKTSSSICEEEERRGGGLEQEKNKLWISENSLTIKTACKISFHLYKISCIYLFTVSKNYVKRPPNYLALLTRIFYIDGNVLYLCSVVQNSSP